MRASVKGEHARVVDGPSCSAAPRVSRLDSCLLYQSDAAEGLTGFVLVWTSLSEKKNRKPVEEGGKRRERGRRGGRRTMAVAGKAMGGRDRRGPTAFRDGPEANGGDGVRIRQGGRNTIVRKKPSVKNMQRLLMTGIQRHRRIAVRG